MQTIEMDLRKDSTINPKTGSVWRLTDKEVAGGMKSLREKLSSRDGALQFLKEHGLLTEGGRIPRKYGGR